jgi:hypothetical protein
LILGLGFEFGKAQAWADARESDGFGRC